MASQIGGGMLNIESSPNVLNSIIFYNIDITGFNEASQIWHLSGVLTLNYSCILGLTGGLGGIGNLSVDPLFVDIGGGDFRLTHSSGCIDAGDNTAVPGSVTTDLDGKPRFFDDPETADTGVGTPPIVDIGAYEFNKVCGDADHPNPMGDVNIDCGVDLADFAICALAWLSGDGEGGWNSDCNLYDADLVIDTSDLKILGAHWLECTKPECD
jgi:hypothetical protein